MRKKRVKDERIIGIIIANRNKIKERQNDKAYKSDRITHTKNG